jgi:hypothetical protein
MLNLISAALKSAPEEFWLQKIQSDFGISCHPKEPGEALDPILLRQTYQILSQMTPALVKATGVKDLFYSNRMGPNQPYFPNHGLYIDHTVTLNSDIFYHPDIQDDFFDDRGYFLSRPSGTLIHELGHATDDVLGLLSEKPEWLQLSGWSQTPKPGLRRLIINDPRAPSPVIGEWFYKPTAAFTRFYARRNPWDDWADSYAFYVGGLKDKVPPEKRKYFDHLLGKYFKKKK